MNEGAFQFAKLCVDPILESMGLQEKVKYVGRPSMHSFATGAPSINKA